MSYDFDKIIDRRGTNSEKWDALGHLFGNDELLSMWVADMDFPCGDFITEALSERIKHPFYGYTFPGESLLEVIIEKAERDYGWKIEREWILFSNGVVDGAYNAIKALTDGVSNPGIIIQPPVYYPFFNIIKKNKCRIVENPLQYRDNKYSIDFDHYEGCYREDAQALLLCSPHNPVGRVWTKAELERLAEITLRNKAAVISDEIHCDIVFEPNKHTVLATLSKEIEKQSITFMAASKTFNIPGLSTSVVIIPDKGLRSMYSNAQIKDYNGNIFGYIATEAAFRHGEEFRRQMLSYVRSNMDYFIDYINTHLPQFKVINPEGTYLLWLDMREWAGIEANDGYALHKAESLNRFIIDKCKLALDDGVIFGKQGAGFQRFNLACPRAYVEQALKQLHDAVKAKGKL